MMKWKKKAGILKSKFMYDFRPFNNRRLVKFYSKFIGPGDLCFDVGAHTGNRSAAWLKMGARVVAVEPQPLFADLLHKKFSAIPHFHLVTDAVGYERGSALLKVSSLHPMVSTLSSTWTALIKNELDSVTWDEDVPVHIIRLDDLIQQYGIPRFCKLDVEGVEEEALRGLSDPITVLSFEFFPKTPNRTMQCLQILSALGDYEFNWSAAEELTLHSEIWLSFEQMKTAMESYKSKRSGDVYARLKG